MDDNRAQQSGTSPPPKPWERSGSSSGPAPFKPPSSGNTSDIVEASGTARPGEIVTTPDANTAAANRNVIGRSLPSRPWEQQQTYNNSSYMGAGYGSSLNNSSGYGSGTYGSYGGGMYGNSMYRGGMNGGAGSLYGGGMYGGGMYNSSFGGAMGGYGGMGNGMGMGGPPYGDQDPNNPFAAPSSPPGFWVSFMHVMQGVVTFFGRVAMLIDQNTQAFHMFMSALLQLFDRSGMLYGELARFVFRLFGIRAKSQKVQLPHPNGLPGPRNFPGGQNHIEGPKVAPSGAWDGVWGNEPSN